MTQHNQLQIIATGITTLDEARYFAAMGVDWLGFDMNQLRADDIKAMAEWVVGPMMFVEMQNVEEDLLFEINTKIHPQGIYIRDVSGVPPWYEGAVIRQAGLSFQEETLLATRCDILLFRSTSFDRNADNIASLRKLCVNRTCWIEWDAAGFPTVELSRIARIHGIVLRCTERAPGSDDVYAHYDQFFENVEVIRNTFS